MRRRWWILLSIVVLAAAGVWLWSRARSAPAWYAPPDPGDAEVASLAEQAEYRLVEEVQRIRPPEQEWTVRVPEEQVNAWLAARLPEWIAHERDLDWPEGLGTPQIRIGDGRISVAVDVMLHERSQVVVARVSPRVVGGRLDVSVDRVGLGLVELPGTPAEKLAALLDEVLPAAAADERGLRMWLEALADRGPLDSRLDLSDGRRIEMLDLRCVDGAIELTSRTVPK